jgi:copper chaperone CopZ
MTPALAKKGQAIGNECRSSFLAGVEDAKLAAQAEQIVGEAAPNGLSPAEKIAQNAAQRFKNFECFECADAIETALKQSGQSGVRVSLDTGFSYGEKAMITSRQFTSDVISESGLHDAVYVDRFIFDNHNPNGVLPLNFFNDLHVGPPIQPSSIPFQINVRRFGL